MAHAELAVPAFRVRLRQVVYLGIFTHRVRADRILEEAAASIGDLRAMRAMLGITVETAQRYAAMAAEHRDPLDLS